MFHKGTRRLSVQGDRLYGSDMAMVFVVVVVTSADTRSPISVPDRTGQPDESRLLVI